MWFSWGFIFYLTVEKPFQDRHMNNYELLNEIVVLIVGNLSLAQAVSMNIISAKNIVSDCIKVVLLVQIVLNIVYITLSRSI